MDQAVKAVAVKMAMDGVKNAPLYDVFRALYNRAFADGMSQVGDTGKKLAQVRGVLCNDGHGWAHPFGMLDEIDALLSKGTEHERAEADDVIAKAHAAALDQAIQKTIAEVYA